MRSPASVAPVLVIGVGNLSRGDDALGILLAERLEAWLAAEGIGGVEVLTDVQLQPEHAIDLAGRRHAMIIDAGVAGKGPYAHGAVEPVADWSFTTHAVSPGAVAEMARAMGLNPPAAVELLVVQGHDFELGNTLSRDGRQHLEAAWTFLREWCRESAGAAVPG